MKKYTNFLIGAALSAALFIFISAKFPAAPENESFEYYQFSTIESVVKAGIGRSRLISTDANGELTEEKMENFFSAVGINFGNVRHNDQMIVEKINSLTDEGWLLYNTSTGVYADPKGNSGIFISRYLFRRSK